FSTLLPLADADFRVSKKADLSGVIVDGFDFSGWPSNPPNYTPPDKDAVWLEGTAEMAVAYYATGNKTKGDFFTQEVGKSIVNPSSLDQGIAYATNMGTAYGFYMDSTHPAASSMAWYLFAKYNFNPLRPFALQTVTVQNIADNQASAQVTWTASVPNSWIR